MIHNPLEEMHYNVLDTCYRPLNALPETNGCRSSDVCGQMCKGPLKQTIFCCNAIDIRLPKTGRHFGLVKNLTNNSDQNLTHVVTALAWFTDY
jgi:hypothetical protein